MAVFDKERNLFAFMAIVLIGSVAFDNADGHQAAAENRWPEWNETSRLDLAKCIRAESDNFKRDWPLLAWCLVKQWRGQPFGRTISGQIRAHCAVFDRGNKRYYNDRQKQIRGSTWENPLHGTREDWKELRGFVSDFTAGKIPDECPVCMWWQGRTDRAFPNWVCPVDRVNGRGNRFCYTRNEKMELSER